MGILHLDLLSAKDLPAADSNGKSDPYCVVTMNGKFLHKTKVHKKTLNPVFDEGLQIEVTSRLRSRIYIEIYDNDVIGKDTLLGRATLHMASLSPDQVVNTEIAIENTSAKLSVRYFFEPKDLVTNMSVEHLTEKSTKNSKLLTETTSLGKFGRGLTSHVTGILKKDKKSEKSTLVVGKPAVVQAAEVPVDAEPAIEAKRVEKDNFLNKRRPVKGDTVASLTPTTKILNDESEPAPKPINDDSSQNTVKLEAPTIVTEAIDNGFPPKSRVVSTNIENLVGTPSIPRSTPSLKSNASALLQNDHDFLEIMIQILEAKDLTAGHGDTSDPYVKVNVEIGSKTKSVMKTSTCKKSLNPKWDEEYAMIPMKAGTVTFSIFDHITLGKDILLGTVVVLPDELFNEAEQFERWFPIEGGSGELRISGMIVVKSEEKSKFLSLGRKRRISNSSRVSMQSLRGQ